MIKVVTGEVTLPDKREFFERNLTRLTQQGYSIMSSNTSREQGKTYLTVILQKLTDQ